MFSKPSAYKSINSSQMQTQPNISSQPIQSIQSIQSIEPIHPIQSKVIKT
jgi:hypothetical protein